MSKVDGDEVKTCFSCNAPVDNVGKYTVPKEVGSVGAIVVGQSLSHTGAFEAELDLYEALPVGRYEVYTHPITEQPAELTDSQIDEIASKFLHHEDDSDNYIAFAKAVLAAANKKLSATHDERREEWQPKINDLVIKYGRETDTLADFCHYEADTSESKEHWRTKETVFDLIKFVIENLNGR